MEKRTRTRLSSMNQCMEAEAWEDSVEEVAEVADVVRCDDS